MDGWQSGRLRTPGKRVYRKVSGVRIPPHPRQQSECGSPRNSRRQTGTASVTQSPPIRGGRCSKTPVEPTWKAARCGDPPPPWRSECGSPLTLRAECGRLAWDRCPDSCAGSDPANPHPGPFGLHSPTRSHLHRIRRSPADTLAQVPRATPPQRNGQQRTSPGWLDPMTRAIHCGSHPFLSRPSERPSGRTIPESGAALPKGRSMLPTRGGQSHAPAQSGLETIDAFGSALGLT